MSRMAAAFERHPMTGGVGRVRRDSASDYSTLRLRVFGVDRVPLPKSLALSKADEALNRSAKLVLPA